VSEKNPRNPCRMGLQKEGEKCVKSRGGANLRRVWTYVIVRDERPAGLHCPAAGEGDAEREKTEVIRAEGKEGRVRESPDPLFLLRCSSLWNKSEEKALERPF